MHIVEVEVSPEFSGTKEEQELSKEIFQHLSSAARYYAQQAPIRVNLEVLTEHFASHDNSKDHSTWSSEIDKALATNTQVFLRDEREDGVVVFATTRIGIAPVPEKGPDVAHQLARRFEEPEPLPEPRSTVRKPVQSVSGWHDDTVRMAEPQDLQDEVPAIGEDEDVDEDVMEETETPVESRVSDIVDSSDVNLDELDDETLRHSLMTQLASEMSVAQFGDLWMDQSKIDLLGRNALRRIQEYLSEQGGIATDELLVQDIEGVSPADSGYETRRFALNYSLSREERDFEFVGHTEKNAWALANRDKIGTDLRKPAEIGNDYRFQLQHPTVLEESDIEAVDHVLTFYEHRHGVLPLDGALKELLPDAAFEVQRASIIYVEESENFETFPVEIRYPSGNRGGYVSGFERFFRSSLVPGALITLEKDPESEKYLLGFLPVSAQDRKLLELDEKTGEYRFKATTFYCATQEDMVVHDNRFPRFAGKAPLDERSRRRPEVVLAETFVRVGEKEEQDGQLRYMAMLDEILSAANVERPFSEALLRAVVESDEHSEFSVDPGADDVFYYEPPAES